MRKKSGEIKRRLVSIIREMARTPWLFAVNPKKDFTRKRKISFESLLLLLLTMAGGTLRTELWKFAGLKPEAPTASAFIQQRSKLLPLALEYILRSFAPAPKDIKRFSGARLIAVDGSDLHTPTNPQEPQSFFRLKPDGMGYNLMHLNALYDLTNDVFLDAIIHNRRASNESKALIDMVDRSDVKGRVIILADRAYEAYNNFAHIERKGWHYLIRVKDITAKSGILTGLNLPSSPTFDLHLDLILTRNKTKATRAQPDRFRSLNTSTPFDFLDLNENKEYPIAFRVLRFNLPNGDFEAVITNLPPDQFSPSDIKALYHLRWGIETAYRALKHAVGLVAFHSKKADHIAQEVFASLVMYNFVSMNASASFIPKITDHFVYQVNFSQAVHICREFLRCRNAHPPDVEALIRACALPVRPDRSYHRNVRFRQAVSFNYRLA